MKWPLAVVHKVHTRKNTCRSPASSTTSPQMDSDLELDSASIALWDGSRAKLYAVLWTSMARRCKKFTELSAVAFGQMPMASLTQTPVTSPTLRVDSLFLYTSCGYRQYLTTICPLYLGKKEAVNGSIWKHVWFIGKLQLAKMQHK